ncbi:MAG: hypothetical protein LBO69_07900 [Ignavibacteria bacterium]|jgi:GTP pyrophosphokinase|nr:hypothetical protein [Ignavibacteria bacterium]
MDNFQTYTLKNVELAPYLQLATALIGKSRRIGGNQFRHIWATVGILIDHKVIDSTILKAAALHDLKEDAPGEYYPDQIRKIDRDGPRVVELVEELSIRDGEPKSEYLLRVMVHSSNEAKLIKLADRISNLTDIQLGTFDIVKVQKTISDTEKYILPYAKDVNLNMYNEIVDLIQTRTKYVQKTIELIANKVLGCVKNTINDYESVFQKLADLQVENTIKDINSLITIDNIANRQEIEEDINDDLTGFRQLLINSFEKVITEVSSEKILHITYSQFY